MAAVSIDSGGHAQIACVMGGADDGMAFVGKASELLAIPGVTEFTGDVEAVNGDDVGDVQFGQQIRSDVGGGAELNPQDIWLECLELCGQLFSAPATFGQRPDILSGELSTNDVVQLLGNVVKVKGRDIGVSTCGVPVAAERLDFGDFLKELEVVDEKGLAGSDGGIAEPTDSRSLAHPFSRFWITWSRSSEVNSGNMGKDTIRLDMAVATGKSSSAEAFHSP